MSFLLLLIAYIFKLIASLTSLITKRTNIGSFLMISLFCDLAWHTVNKINTYPTPYTGVGMILFSISTILFLAIPTALGAMVCKAFDLKRLIAPVLLTFATVTLGCLIIYPAIRGQAMIAVLYSYYLTILVPSLLIPIYKMHKIKLSVDQALLMLATFASLVQLGIVIYLGDAQWFLVSVSNYIFYSGIILACFLKRKS
jgi:hypothetical protein